MLLGARAAAVFFFSEPKQMLLFAKQRCTFFRKISSLLLPAGGALVGERQCFVYARCIYVLCNRPQRSHGIRPARGYVVWSWCGTQHKQHTTQRSGMNLCKGLFTASFRVRHKSVHEYGMQLQLFILTPQRERERKRDRGKTGIFSFIKQKHPTGHECTCVGPNPVDDDKVSSSGKLFSC